MDQIKIGAFIAERRRHKGLTQASLAEQLGITDRAVSKWETGKSMPDSSLMLELCELLGITVNDLLTGEVVTVENYNKELEHKLLETMKEKEEADRRLLTLEIFIGVTVSVLFLSLIFIASFAPMANWLRVFLIALGFIPFAIGLGYAIRIEQTAGYYECSKCGHRYVPSYQSVLFSMHLNRTRYMKCPHCRKKSWQKKVLTKE